MGSESHAILKCPYARILRDALELSKLNKQNFNM